MTRAMHGPGGILAGEALVACPGAGNAAGYECSDYGRVRCPSTRDLIAAKRSDSGQNASRVVHASAGSVRHRLAWKATPVLVKR